jgi:hypothetical protein
MVKSFDSGGRLSGGAAAVNSQGRQPLERDAITRQSPGGATVGAALSGLAARSGPFSRASRPWLLTAAAPRLNTAARCHDNSGWLALVCAVVLLFFVSEISPAQDTHARRASGPLQYPKRVAIPEDIPATYWTIACPGKCASELVFPVAIYSWCHYEGWQMCLKDLAVDGKKAKDCEYEQPFVTLRGEPFTPRGWEEGYAACRQAAGRLVKRYGDEGVRRFAKSAYCPLPPIPPPPVPDDDSHNVKGRTKFVPGYPPVGGP